tara:strand:+ start:57 stop:1277 length:1221 start_codon:yes stop_codon:yes gene_type:complete
MKNKNLILIFIFIWFFSIIFTAYYVHKNFERIQILKNSLNNVNYVNANAYSVNIIRVLKLNKKTAYILNNNTSGNFNTNDLEIFTQDGYLIKNGNEKKLNTPDNFTLENNGGLKNIMFVGNKVFALLSAKKDKCFLGKIYNISENKNFIDLGCLPDRDNTDFNGLGSSVVYLNNKLLLSVGTVDANLTLNSELSQNINSPYGKILSIEYKSLRGEKSPETNVYSLGHRNPQGMSKINNQTFSVEHGPKGGDELNRIEKDGNYGWPLSSYGTRYMIDSSGKSLPISHERSGFKEPMIALVPSVGISALSQCPKKLKNYYKKNCLIALSLYGNKLRKGRSLIIFLINDDLSQVNSVEQIYLGSLGKLRLRHFVTNSKNELFEDKEGNIYVSADRKGIYKISFDKFRSR